ncbi:MAG: hypothetical protein M3N12_05730 [Verrucomicrobiota bacterium]|nr:hypothetical protein [Verrucomicrobiota bacterium]
MAESVKIHMKNILALLPWSVSVLAIVRLQATTIELPKDGPVFSITFPDVWTTETKDNVITSKPESGNLLFSILPARGAKDLADALAIITKAAEAQFKELSTEKGVQEVEHGITFLTAEAKGKKEGLELSIFLTTFSPDDVQYFGIILSADHAAGEEHGGAVDRIMNSIWSPKKSKKKEGPIPVAYPQDKPVFTVQAPPEWTVDATAERLVIKAKGWPDAVGFARIPVGEGVTNVASAEAWLLKNGPAVLKSAGIEGWNTDTKPFPAWVGGNEGSTISYDGEIDTHATAIKVSVFTPDRQNYFSLYVIETEIMGFGIEENEIINSIKRVD